MGIIQTVEEKLGIKRPMADQPQQGQPVMVTEEVPNAPQAPDSVAPQDVPETQAPEKPAEDRSAYDCVPCKGEGLLENGTVCSDCLGTGKTSARISPYPEGTILVKQEGTYKIENGQEVKLEEQA